VVNITEANTGQMMQNYRNTSWLTQN